MQFEIVCRKLFLEVVLLVNLLVCSLIDNSFESVSINFSKTKVVVTPDRKRRRCCYFNPKSSLYVIYIKADADVVDKNCVKRKSCQLEDFSIENLDG